MRKRRSQARRRRTRAEQQAETRRRLIEAAARVFPRQGFHGASVEQIAAAAGLSHGALYSNFSGKEDLFLALAEDYAIERVRESSELFEDNRSYVDQVRDAADVWMDRFASDPETAMLRVEFALHAARRPELRARHATRSAPIRLMIERQLKAHAKAEAVKYPLAIEDLALVIRALAIGLTVEALADPNLVRRELYGDFLTILFDLIEGRRPSPPRQRRRSRDRQVD